MDYKNIETYDYDLDESLIAQTPIKERDHSKLLIVNRKDGNYKDEVFYNIINYLHKGDVLVLNNTKVLPSRIIGYKTDTNAKIEVLLLTDLDNNVWECLVRPQKEYILVLLLNLMMILLVRLLKLRIMVLLMLN